MAHTTNHWVTFDTEERGGGSGSSSPGRTASPHLLPAPLIAPGSNLHSTKLLTSIFGSSSSFSSVGSSDGEGGAGGRGRYSELEVVRGMEERGEYLGWSPALLGEPTTSWSENLRRKPEL